MFEELARLIDEAIDGASRTDSNGEAGVLILARLLQEKADEAASLFIAK